MTTRTPEEKPEKEGPYLVCAFQWDGPKKPKRPDWGVMWFWPHRTGGWYSWYDNLEVVAWQELPPIPKIKRKRKT